jgi:RNA polymerase sigma-70 factor (ECF subfamily)
MTPSGAQDIYSRHQRDVYRYILRMTGRTDIADDVCQDVFLRIIRALENGGTVGHERGWVFAIARNLMADHRRTQLRRVVTDNTSPEPAANASQALRFGLDEALAHLADADRDAFLLKEIGGLTYAEIADVCSCTVDSVRARLFRTRMQLRADLEGLR